MYWNQLRHSPNNIGVPWLIETWDVLKWQGNRKRIRSGSELIETWDVLKLGKISAEWKAWLRLIETWDVLKSPTKIQGWDKNLINRNMRCIEIHADCEKEVCPIWLIETWDVLKSQEVYKYFIASFAINRNMRCIEMRLHILAFTLRFWINRNMRCIEIRVVPFFVAICRD